MFDRQPEVHRFGLAQFLTNWAGDLLSADQAFEAVQPGRQALKLFRELQEANPDMYNADLRLGLENLATYLEQIGEFDEASDFRKEAQATPVEDDGLDEEWEGEDEVHNEDEESHSHNHGHFH